MRQRIHSAIGVLAFAAKVADSCFGVANGVQRVGKSGPPQRLLKKQCVVGIAFRK
jgi:hypothetical protein